MRPARTTGIATNWQRTWTPRLTSELKLSYTDDNLWWDRAHPDVPIWTAALDDHLDERGYIVPGLGDAGDRMFGTK